MKKIYNQEEAKYALEYFYDTITDKAFLIENSEEIIKGLKKKNYYFKQLVEESMLFGDDADLEIFRKEFEKIKDLKEPKKSDDDLPF